MFEEGVCVGWQAQSEGRCFSKLGAMKIFKQTEDGTELLRLRNVTSDPRLGYIGWDFSWESCFDNQVDPPLCTACPDTTL